MRLDIGFGPNVAFEIPPEQATIIQCTSDAELRDILAGWNHNYIEATHITANLKLWYQVFNKFDNIFGEVASKFTGYFDSSSMKTKPLFSQEDPAFMEDKIKTVKQILRWTIKFLPYSVNKEFYRSLEVSTVYFYNLVKYT